MSGFLFRPCPAIEDILATLHLHKHPQPRGFPGWCLWATLGTQSFRMEYIAFHSPQGLQAAQTDGPLSGLFFNSAGRQQILALNVELALDPSYLRVQLGGTSW